MTHRSPVLSGAIVRIILAALVALALLPATASDAAVDCRSRIAFLDISDGDNRVATIRPDGSARRDIGPSNQRPYEEPVWSPDGERLAYSRTTAEGTSIIVSVRSGRSTRRVTTGPHDSDPDWSPDGTRLAFTRTETTSEGSSSAVMVVNVSTGEEASVSDDASQPTFSPDGTRVAFAATSADGTTDIYSSAPDGSDRTQVTSDADSEDHAPEWSPDGDELVFERWSFEDGSEYLYSDIWKVEGDGGGPVRLTEHNNGYNGGQDPHWSPTGERISYTFYTDGHSAAMVIRPNGAGRTAITRGDTDSFRLDWAPDGRRVVFVRHPERRRFRLTIARADGSNKRDLAGGDAPDWTPC